MELDLFTTPIYRYSSGPIDNFQDYISVFDFKNTLLKRYSENIYQWYGVQYWLDYASMLLKRHHEKLNLKGEDHRDYQIWFDIDDYSTLKGNEIRNVYLILKQENNGIMHLLTFKTLTPVSVKDGNIVYQARHEFDLDWELDGVY